MKVSVKEVVVERMCTYIDSELLSPHHAHTPQTHTHTTKTHIHTQGRTGDAAVEVLKSVRFPNMSRDYLMHIVDTEQIIKQNSECLKMVSSPLHL